jgi:sialic acid synthase SpsE
VFFIAQIEISLLGEVNLARDLVDNQRSCGAKMAGFNLSI